MGNEELQNKSTDFHDLSPVGYFTLDENGLILETNLTGAGLLGRSKDYLINQPLTRFIARDNQDQFYLYCQRVFETKIRQTCELKLVKEDGTPCYTRLSSIAVPDSKGTGNHVRMAILDITEHKRVEAERERLLAAEQEQRLQAEVLKEAFLTLTTQTNPKAILDEILYQLKHVIPYSAANVMSLENDILRIVHWQGYASFGNEGLVSTLEQSLANFPLDAKAIQLQQAVVIPDTHQEPDWIVMDESSWIRSFMAVPLCLHEQVLGLLRLDSDVPNRFSSKDIVRVQPLANAAAIALISTPLYDQTRLDLAKRVIQAETEIIQLNRKLLILQYASTTITSNLDLHYVLDTVIKEMANLLKVAGCAIFMWDRVTNTISAMTRFGLNSSWEKGALVETYSVAEFLLIQRVLVERRPQQITINHPGVYSAELAYMQEAELKTLLIVPMEFQDSVVGLVKMMDVQRERTFTNREIGLVQLLGNQIAGAIENVKLYQQGQQQLIEQMQVEKDLRKVATRQQAILNAIPDSLFYFSHDGKLLEYKTNSENIPPGILDKTIVSENLRTASPTNLVDLIRQYIHQTLDSRKMQSFEFQLLLPEGPQDFEVRLVTSGPNEVLAIVRNVTEYKQM